MIDYTKIYLIRVDYRVLMESPYLEFKSDVSTKTGKINENCFVANYLFCTITIKINKKENGSDITHITFTGSIHKLWNELNGIKSPNYNPEKAYSGYNGNDFTIYDIFKVREHLETVLGCKSNQMIFQNIELGVNLTPDFYPKLFLRGLMYHRNKLFQFTHNGNNAQAEHNNFYFKIYNKSFQYKITYSVLRVELKIKKMVEIKQLNFRTFEDINENVLNKAKDLLLKKFDEVVNYDYTIDKNNLSKIQKRQIENYSNPRYWIEDLKPQHRDRHRKNLNQIIINYSDNLHLQIRNKIIEKCVIINRLTKDAKCVIINTSNIELNITQSTTKSRNKIYHKNDEVKKSICSVTGLNLCNEKKGTKYALTTTLKKLKETDSQTFELVRLNLLKSSCRKPKFEQDEIKHLAKQIRNKYYNSFKIKQQGYNQTASYFQYSQLNILNTLGMN